MFCVPRKNNRLTHLTIFEKKLTMHRKLTLLIVLISLISVTELTAQSKNKNSKTIELEAKKDSKNEVHSIWTYVIMDLYKERDKYEARLLETENNERYEYSYEERVVQKKKIMAQKKAAENLRERSFYNEADFLRVMQDQKLELVSVSKDEGKDGEFKRFYFKREVILRKDSD